MEEKFLRRAIELASQSVRQSLGGPFGAVIVKDNEVIGDGWNRVTTSMDPTAHAEVCAIRAACKTLDHYSLAGCEIYSSCEPCPMCLAAILWARLDRVFYAASAEDAARAGFDDVAFYSELEKEAGNRSIPQSQRLQSEAQAVFDAWVAKADKQTY